MGLTDKELNRVSKFLSYVLRHRPEDIGLVLDNEGWASISELIEKAQPKLPITRQILEQVVATNDKKRFKISDDGLKIRASQGHSVNVDLALKPQKPPDTLYHGTATRFLDSIQKEGLKSGQRQYVHLSIDIDTAKAVGKRYGKPAILQIDALTMYQQGYNFYCSENQVWLVDKVPPLFITNVNKKIYIDKV